MASREHWREYIYLELGIQIEEFSSKRGGSAGGAGEKRGVLGSRRRRGGRQKGEERV